MPWATCCGGAAAPGRSAAQRWGRAGRLGREVGEEVSGGARRGPGGAWIGTLGREPEMGEDLADHPGILDGRDEPHAPPTARAREHVRGHASTSSSKAGL